MTGMTEPRWLRPDEQVEWMSFVLATRLLWGQFERDLQRDAQLPVTYYEILSTLSEIQGRALALSQLATLLQVSPSRLSHALSRLEEAGWVRRELRAGDRRQWRAVLTDAGMAVLRAAAPVHVESVRTHLLDQLTPAQVAQLGEISRALLAHLAPGLDVAHAMARSREEGQVDADSLDSLSQGARPPPSATHGRGRPVMVPMYRVIGAFNKD